MNSALSLTVTWSASDLLGVTGVDIAFSTNNGGSWTPIASGEANDGSYTWLVPNAVSTQARVRVTAWDAASNSGSGQSVQFTDQTAPAGLTCSHVSDPASSLEFMSGGGAVIDYNRDGLIEGEREHLTHLVRQA